MATRIISFSTSSATTSSPASGTKHVPESIVSVVRIGAATKVCEGGTCKDWEGAFAFVGGMHKWETRAEFDRRRAAYPNYSLSDGGCRGWTALAVAIKNESLPLIWHILNEDPSLINQGFYENTSCTPLACAAGHLNPAFALTLVKLLVSLGAEINLACGRADSNTALFTSAEKATHRNVTKFLLLRGAVVYQNEIEHRLKGNWAKNSIERAQQVLPNIADAIEELWGIQCFKNASLHSEKRKSFVSELPFDMRLKIAAFVG